MGLQSSSSPPGRTRLQSCPFWNRSSSCPGGAHLTCDPAAEQLQAQGDACVPALRADPDEPGQQRRVQLVEDHLGGVAIGLEHLETHQRVLPGPARALVCRAGIPAALAGTGKFSWALLPTSLKKESVVLLFCTFSEAL